MNMTKLARYLSAADGLLALIGESKTETRALLVEFRDATAKLAEETTQARAVKKEAETLAEEAKALHDSATVTHGEAEDIHHAASELMTSAQSKLAEALTAQEQLQRDRVAHEQKVKTETQALAQRRLALDDLHGARLDAATDRERAAAEREKEAAAERERHAQLNALLEKRLAALRTAAGV